MAEFALVAWIVIVGGSLCWLSYHVGVEVGRNEKK